jgi:cytochrome c oxidase subunit 2
MQEKTKQYFAGWLALIYGSIIMGGSAYASQPKQWQFNFQTPASPVMEELLKLHNYLLVMCFAIVGLVILLVGYVLVKYNAKANPTPKKFSHNAVIEIVWTIVPCIILIVIAIPSFRSLYHIDKSVDADMTVKIVGNQWYWIYQYPDHGNFIYDSYMLEEDELPKNGLRLLEVDNRVVIPENTNVKFLVTSGDVIHSWAVPAFGIKCDAVPGRVNETWVRAKRPGVYYGQCSELCGVNHGFMPIAVEVVTKPEFEEWAKKAKEKFTY